MKLLINNEYIEEITKINPSKIEQGSEEWLKLKLGVISASNIDSVLAKKGSQTRLTYQCELVAQIGTGEFPEISGKPLEWGKENEQNARSAFELATGKEVEKVSFIYGDKTLRCGCSPDGILINEDAGIEIKCPWNSKYHAEFLCADKIKPEYIKQIQFSMWVTGLSKWYFCSYDPRFNKFPLGIREIQTDKEMQERFDKEVPEFIFEMDALLKQSGIKWGEQWISS